MINKIPNNKDIARLLEEIADLLEIQKANPHRIRSYHRAAQLIRQREENLAITVAKGNGEALEAIPGIGENLARLIKEYVLTGKSQLLQRLQGEVTPEELFEQIPGIGKETAEKIVRELHLKTLEDLEQAAYDGRLANLQGFGKRRIDAIRLGLAGMLSGFARRRILHQATELQMPTHKPDVSLLLEVDKAYRENVGKNKLKKIAPRRFNPNKEAWLPIFHTELEDWDFTALYSNTIRAHDLGKTRDWVIIYYEKDGVEDQSTVVTETSGPLAGLRVVRGREPSCKDFYAKKKMQEKEANNEH